MPSGKKHKDFKNSSIGGAEVVLGGGTYMKKEYVEKALEKNKECIGHRLVGPN